VLAGPSKVKHLLVEGREIVRDGRIVTFDLPQMIAEQNRLARRLHDLL
jgi:hypothetical protein